MQHASDEHNIVKKKVLFISHKEHQCGVHQYGRNIADAFVKSRTISFMYNECSGSSEYYSIVEKVNPSAIIYNYHPSTLPWLNKKVVRKVKVPHIEIIHEVSQEVVDAADDSFFHYHIAPDPTLLKKNPLVFKTGRLVLEYKNQYELPKIPTIGSFGFGMAGKGFHKLISRVQDEFDTAIIRLHIPFATFGDSDGKAAHSIAKQCKELIVKPGIELQLSHEFLSQKQLFNFLAQNSLNAFFYDEHKGRGISSVIDFALAVQRPIAITKSSMFRHIISTWPSICVEDSSLVDILQNGFGPLSKYCLDWNEANLIWDYERLTEAVLQIPVRNKFYYYYADIRHKLKKRWKKIKLKTHRDTFTPTLKPDVVQQQIGKDDKCRQTSIPGVTSFNRILDNTARQMYRPVIDAMYDLLPEMMSRKIPEANIQQAFVLDTVQKHLLNHISPKILCIGSYDDTAAAALKKYGYTMDEVDPVLNYDLNTFMDRPSTIKCSYDVVFSTSVIEHVKDDELFIKQIDELLAPGGTAILTCDYKDQYKQGDPIPPEDFRLYTQKDFMERLLPLITDGSLVDTPHWDCSDPDFVYANCRYTFATLVFMKNKP
jgi:SAM-dependent methyltransferase